MPSSARKRKAADADAQDVKAVADGAASAATLFAGLKVVFSGTLPSLSQADARALITERGGAVSAVVSAAVTHFVATALGSSKTNAAARLGIPLMKPAWLHACIDRGALLTDAELQWTAAAAQFHDSDDGRDEDADEGDRLASTPAKQLKADLSLAAPLPLSPPPPPSPPAAAAATAAAPVLKVVLVKGCAPVDEHCPVAASTHVYEDHSGAWDAMLNQTNIAQNANKSLVHRCRSPLRASAALLCALTARLCGGCAVLRCAAPLHCRFFVVQLLQADSGSACYFWSRWGRVGERGQSALTAAQTLSAAQALFLRKFRDKTGSAWHERANCGPRPGKYTVIARDFSTNDAKAASSSTSPPSASSEPALSAPAPVCSLDARVASLVALICDVGMMQRSMVQIGYDADRLPLGKLSKDHIRKGYSVLTDIADALGGDRATHAALVQLSNAFYSLIPHAWGRRVPEVIASEERVKEKLRMLEDLGDIEAAIRLLHPGDDQRGEREHVVDRHYRQLGCAIRSLERDSDAFRLIAAFVSATHARTHSAFELEVEDAFELDRDGEAQRFAPHAANVNRMLLWHGSRLSNFTGILSRGLLIAPPEAPATGCAVHPSLR